jgi:HlyD family secretion protein
MMQIIARIARLLVFAVVAFAVLLFGGWWFINQPAAEGSTAAAQSATVLDTLVVQRGALDVTVSATGSITPQEQVALFFEGSGRVAEIDAPEGARVRAGDRIARLDTSALDSTIAETEIAVAVQRVTFDALDAPVREVDRAVAEAAVNAAQAALNAAYSSGNPNTAQVAALQAEIARNRLYQAQLQRDIAANTPSFTPSIAGFIPDGVEIPPEIIEQLNRGLSGLIPSFSTSPDPAQFASGLTQAEFGVQIADANAAAAAGRGADSGSIAQANAGLVAARAALDRLENGASDLDRQAAMLGVMQAENALAQTRAAAARASLTTPIAGVVAQNNLRLDEPPPSQNFAVLVIDDSALYVDLAVDETDVVSLEVGQPATLRLDALPDVRITGQVSEIAVTPVRAAGLVTYAVRVRIDPTDEPIRIGMSATATVVVRSLDDALVVPNRFVRIDRATGDAFVTVERAPNVFEEQRVRLGVRNATESEVLSGISEGDRLVIRPRSTFDPFR